ncbi:MAG: radical SAM/Cys-rich domain protein [Deltaproteobacteria bacterium]|nr:MAG: radical SAM/Cys-rich domain protein [Deltaproteobacteria bacterium]
MTRAASLPVVGAAAASRFHVPLARASVDTLQINVGKRCNQACKHCHVDAGPSRTEEMSRDVAARVLDLVAADPAVATVDITGGAPELNPQFRWIVERATALGRHVIDRCNLTVLLEPGQEDLAAFLARHRVHVIASLPCYTADNVDRQRGRGVFERSIAGLRRLNELGYGRSDGELQLDLVYNPLGPTLPPPQDALERDYKRRLAAEHGVAFDRLLALTNLPIRRFADDLARRGESDRYLQLLIDHFNPDAVPHVMCRTLVSVSYDGQIYDCDFNQMVDLPAGGRPRTVWDIDALAELAGAPIATADHCFGCTAGAGSSCGGALT